MSLDYAAGHLLEAVRSIAHSEDPLQTRLQVAWDESVQMVWEKPCLTRELLTEFKALWERYTDNTAGPRSTKIRDLTTSEAGDAIDDLVSLAARAAAAAAQDPASLTLATLKDLQ